MANLINSSLIPNVTEIYLASDGTILDETNKQNFHAQSNYANLLSVYIEDGNGENTATLINFSPTNVVGTKKALYTSHWFFMRYQGIVQKTFEGTTRSFAHFYIVVPNIVLRNNGATTTSNTVTVIQRYGANFLGTYDEVSDLPTATEELADDLSTAYVLDTASFYQVQLVESNYTWVAVEQLAAVLQTKQYNTFGITVQAGLSSTSDVTPLTTTVSGYIMQIINELESQGQINSQELTNLDGRMDNAEIDIDALQDDRLLKDGSNADSDITIRDVTFNLDVDTDAIQQTDFAAFAESGKTNLNAYIDSVQDQLDDKLSETELTETFYNKTQTDALLDEKLDITTFTNHTHTESDITDLDKYSTSEADDKFMAKETYLDVNDKILFSKLPDAAKSQTLVVTNFVDLPITGLLSGDKGYVTSTGDSYIWDGSQWQTLSDADWQNVNLDWANITNRPVGNGNTSLASATLYTKSQADTLLAGKSDTGHTHTESEITDLDKYTQQEVDDLLDTKANVTHNHVEADITDLDKYTTTEVDDLLDGKANAEHTHVEADITDLDKYSTSQVDTLLTNKVDKNISSYTEVTEFNDLDTYYVYQDGAKKVSLANLKTYLTSELEGITFQIVTADSETGLPDVASPLTNTIYLIPSDNAAPDVYFEYLWIGSTWEYLGSTEVDLANYYTKEQADVLLSIAKQTQLFYGKASENITKGQAIMLTGQVDDYITFAPATAAGIQFQQELFVGIAHEDITSGEFGYITWFGYITDVPLGFSAGSILYVDTNDGATAGTLTATKPTADKSIVQVAAAVKNGTSNTLLVRPKFISRKIADISGLQAALDGKSDDGHTHIPSEVGLGNVLNYSVASQAEAEAGTANDKYMTPLRTAQAIVELAPAPDLSDYYTETETDTLLSGKANTSHTHLYSDLTGTVPTWNQDTTGNAATATVASTVDNANSASNLTLWTGTQAQYDAIGTPDANTLYFII